MSDMIPDLRTMERQNRSIELRKGNFEVSINSEGAWVEKLSVGGVDVLFPKQIVDIDGNEKARGGMHVCLPQFGPDNRDSLPQHGFGRDVGWEVIERNGDSVRMYFDGSDGQYGVDTSYPPGLVADLTYEIVEDDERVVSLVSTLTIGNESGDSIPVAPGFHPYFNIGPNEEVFFPEAMKPGESKDWKEPTFHAMPEEFELGIGSRRIVLVSKALPEYVVWSDSPEEYVCVEPTELGARGIDSVPVERTMIAHNSQTEYAVKIAVLNE